MLYCGLLMAWIVLLYAFPLVVARSALLARWTRPFPSDYAFQLKGKSFDVVIYGDSTPLYAVDPARISALTGFSVVDLPSTYSIMTNLDEMTLDTYLTHNAKPKALVLMLAPWAGVGVRSPVQYEAYMTVLRWGRLAHLWQMIMRSPSGLQNTERQIMLDFAISLYSPPRHPTELDTVAAANGHITFQKPPMKKSGLCTASVGNPNDHRFIDRFVNKYKNLHYRVIVFAAPIPDCSKQFEKFRGALTGLTANEPHTLPTEWFGDDGMVVHALEPAVPVISSELAQTLNAALKEPAHLD
jgi:hypothetical protein